MENDKIGFCFDLDGTLINSTEIADVIEKKICEKYNLVIDDETGKEIDELTYKIMHGENQKNLAMKVMWGIFKVIGLNFFQRINALLYTSKIFKSELENIKIYDGIEELFEFLESKRYPFIIATTSSQSEVDDRLSKFPRFFEKLKGKIISRSDVENLKPDPESLLKASEMMGLHPKRVVMVGDMHSDILMGKKTDSVTIAVLTGIFKKEDFEKYHPDLILYSAAQIPDNISKIRQLINSK